MIRHYLQTFSV